MGSERNHFAIFTDYYCQSIKKDSHSEYVVVMDYLLQVGCMSVVFVVNSSSNNNSKKKQFTKPLAIKDPNTIRNKFP